jgi:hypothetical protein
VRNDTFTINGERKRVLFAHPPSCIRYPLTLPEGEPALAFDVAMSPESWGQEGDGVTFAVYVETEHHLQPETCNSQLTTCNSQPVFSTTIDPKQNEADPSLRPGSVQATGSGCRRCWHPHTIDLSTYAGQTVTITFATGVGPAGDERYDWAGWGEPRLLKR